MIRKAWTTSADAIILDLEDAVPAAAKNVARNQVQIGLAEAPQNIPRVLVRINPFASSFWQADLERVVGCRIDAVVLPKCESQKAVRAVSRFLLRQEKAAGRDPGSLPLFLLVESAKGLMTMASMLESSPRAMGLMLGGEDFCLDMGIARTLDGTELSYARSSLAVCARAHSCYAIDTIYDNYKDPTGLLREARLSKALGFSGKLAIHPSQIETINSVFIPSAQEVLAAKKVLEAFAQAQTAGSGVTALDGKMIDRPAVERAQRILDMASRVARY